MVGIKERKMNKGKKKITKEKGKEMQKKKAKKKQNGKE